MSGADEACDGRGGLLHSQVGDITAVGRGLADAARQMSLSSVGPTACKASVAAATGGTTSMQ